MRKCFWRQPGRFGEATRHSIWRRRAEPTPALKREEDMAGELEGKVAVVTGAASGIGLASSEAMLALGSRVVMVDRDEAALKRLREKLGDAVIPLVIDLL